MAIDNENEIKLCCAAFYQSDIARMILGDSLHPGGLELTRQLGGALGLKNSDLVLDVACGRGASAVYLTGQFGCHTTGLDYGEENIRAAEKHAAFRGYPQATLFQRGDAENLPFRDNSFDVVISECSFCTFPNKETVAKEMARVLRKGGRLGIADITIVGELSDELSSLFSWVACISGAGSPEEYTAKFGHAGFGDFKIEDHKEALLDMVTAVRRNLLVIELGVGLGKLNLGKFSIGDAKRLSVLATEMINKGALSYALITGRKV
jgi:SAM-dependent methyltransferase